MAVTHSAAIRTVRTKPEPKPFQKPFCFIVHSPFHVLHSAGLSRPFCTINGARRGFIAPCGKFFYFFRAAGPSLQNRLSIPGKMRYNRGRYSKLF
ncbi:hypothetical protein HMPREF1545_03782 [Oscillibacter sp. KLE 1728]|nr:hypothetical protein HMPREF1545_03782 [Oscillibacter sp. KLE 1728]